jgi:hypothetical protein
MVGSGIKSTKWSGVGESKARTSFAISESKTRVVKSLILREAGKRIERHHHHGDGTDDHKSRAPGDDLAAEHPRLLSPTEHHTTEFITDGIPIILRNNIAKNSLEPQVGIGGRSGCGKTTLVSLAAGHP